MKRLGTMQSDGTMGQVIYRPEYYDSVIYNADAGELTVSASTKSERENYCKCMGLCLFGDETFFDLKQRHNKYSLSPLMKLRRSSLICGDIEAINSIKLYELHIRHQNYQRDIEIRRADDVFASMDEDSRNLFDHPHKIKLLRAKFLIKFANQQVRRLSITPPGTVVFDRTTDFCLVSSWLKKRGFIKTALRATNEGVLGTM